jgi:hypothetical protein
VIALLLAHSFVDYPLRTGAMMAILAFSCGLLIEPLDDAETTTQLARVSDRESASRQKLAPPVPVAPFLSTHLSPASGPAENPPSPRQLAGRWGEGMAWPQEWGGIESDRSTGPTRGPEKPLK